MEISAKQIREYRLRVHHLDKKIPMEGMAAAAGVCGLQNTPPGAWETALYNRLEGCTLEALNEALCREKTLVQAWSYRGVPVVFPTEESGIFLTPLIAREGEGPWIYTQGITGALDYLQMDFDDLLERTREAARYLDDHTVKSKETLDRTLAGIVREDLPGDKQALWQGPSMYGNPEKQTVGAAAVSFLLRPCSFSALVVFGERRGISPTFTSFRKWTGDMPEAVPEGEKQLVRKFLHAYGPATVDSFMRWLGCSPKQARRLWATVGDEAVPVQAGGKTAYVLAEDMDSLLSGEGNGERLLLLGAHDPYLDLRDRTVILEDKARHKTVWQYVSNPGVVLRGGRIMGIWKTKTLKDKLDITMTLWETAAPGERQRLAEFAEEYGAFRQLNIRNCTIEGV